MSPTESSILTNFLLSPSSLPTIVSLQKFTDSFPKSQRSNPQIKDLYRELQHIRSLDRDQVKRSITLEVKRGERQRREVVRARRRMDRDEESVDQREMEMEIQMLGITSNPHPAKEAHTLSSILPEMEVACAEMQAEIDTSDLELQAILDDMQATIGDLSDLRYGKFSQLVGEEGSPRENVLDSLEDFDKVCRAKDGS